MGIKNIKDCYPSSMDSYFFDNNIWMFLFCPIGNVSKKKQGDYSRFLESVISSKASIFITSMVLSEFANAYLRLDFELWKNESNVYGASFKNDYLKTKRYKDIYPQLVSCIKEIVKLTERIPDDFNSIDLNNVLSSFEHVDFNDGYYIEFCKTKAFKIVTDDRDFQSITSSKVTVISSI